MNLCMKCRKEYIITNRCFGSKFDSETTKFQVCSDCDREEYDVWFNEKPTYDDYIEIYKYEDNIFDLIDSLPIESRELFYNTFSSDGMMLPEDWISYENNEFPHEKCHEYGLYSFQEIKAYEDRLPICDKVQIVKYSDGSQGSRCVMGAFGNSDGECGLNIGVECYQCELFDERVGDIKIIKGDDYEKLDTEI